MKQIKIVSQCVKIVANFDKFLNSHPSIFIKKMPFFNFSDLSLINQLHFFIYLYTKQNQSFSVLIYNFLIVGFLFVRFCFFAFFFCLFSYMTVAVFVVAFSGTSLLLRIKRITCGSLSPSREKK